ncbi:23S rRNA (pseudouridine1915-N3)-methyltransferase [Desulfonatronum thiosulfatophilum]|uniref:Ribosomal RNA large subunit methyltransferase H n=1 Tax=Desulfonatronum thiosulfatophilum TaxID=617002 RepID=A0A1G6DYJ5_9BACT|nr:23S rRNA (pseudouridine(1915)-N(3))-methyltransferase RlmH [Desulfonatronum thiosulfatophilum]SDB49815.1 23S rRNA (pseudouridine1915-N3)-methyltransferase [Desulfonatronum thiosulfatophilum]
MKSICCLAVGRLKTPHWVAAAEHYVKLISRFTRLDQSVVKDAPGHLSPEARNEFEGRALLVGLGPKDLLLGLDVRGHAYSSEGFSAAMAQWLEDPVRRPCFVIGGAYGLSPPVLDRSDRLISLGTMTLPHELARVVLFEQIYRAMTILRGTGYHH